MSGDFIPMREPSAWELQQEKREKEKKLMEAKQRERAEKIFRLFKNDEEVRHVYASIVNNELSFIDLAQIAGETKLDYFKVKEICRRLADEWILREYYSTMYSTLRDEPRTFHGYINKYIEERDAGEWYHDAVLAVLKKEATELQKRTFEHLKERWYQETELKALQLENSMLRFDLKMALANPEQAQGQAYLHTFCFGTRNLLSRFQDSSQQRAELKDKAYAFCRTARQWTVEDLKNTIKAVQRAKGCNQLEAVREILVRMSEAYCSLFEEKEKEYVKT